MNRARFLTLCLGLAAVAGAQYTVSLPDSLCDPGAQVEVIAVNRAFCEGPAIAPDSTVYFTEQGGATPLITRIRPGGTATVFVNGSGGANGMVLSPAGYLVACISGDLVKVDTGSGVRSTLITDRSGLILGSCNDLTLSSAGEVFFTDPIFGGGTAGNNVYYLSPSGVLSRIAQNLNQPNGLEYAEENRRLYVNVAGDKKIVRYTVGANGALSDPAEFIRNIDNPDGIDLDLNGNLYVAEYATGRIRVFNPAGQDLGYINVRDGTNFNTNNSNVTNCSFGWGDNTYLYITGNKKVFRVKMKVRGRKGNAVSRISPQSPPRRSLAPGREDRPTRVNTVLPRTPYDTMGRTATDRKRITGDHRGPDGVRIAR